jgi:D-glycero-alpha-D-manno-heptose 1-phosphate guanylyltransferase
LISEAIILSGGLGERLRQAVPELPKSLAPVAGQPFLVFVIRHLLSQGVRKFIFSLGYKHELIEKFLEDHFPALDYIGVIEEQPLGTGGAIKLACQKIILENAIIVNGDSIFKSDLRAMAKSHEANKAECTIGLKAMTDFERYGVVEMDDDGKVKNFKEKQFYKSGLINAGTYILNRKSFLNKKWPERFSFEKDYLEKEFPQGKIFGFLEDQYFIDIGIPEDYLKAQSDLRYKKLEIAKVDKSWTLFLDRDGVINHEKEKDYIYNWEEFKFFSAVENAIAKLAEKFGKIIIVSNQRGVGKGLMTQADLKDIHQNMKEKILASGGRVDGIYFCTAVDPRNFFRKPNPGMALQAVEENPDIDLNKTIMVGNKLSDMQFGRNAGIHTVYVRTTNPDQAIPHSDIDLAFDSLPAFAEAFGK